MSRPATGAAESVAKDRSERSYGEEPGRTGRGACEDIGEWRGSKVYL